MVWPPLICSVLLETSEARASLEPYYVAYKLTM